MAASECSNNYRRFKISQLTDFASGLKETYYNSNSPFTSPVVSLSDFDKLIKNYVDTHAAFAGGGQLQKGDFMIAKSELLQAVDKIKDDVNTVAQGNPIVIMEGGFKPTKTSRSKTQLPPTPEIKSLKRGRERELTASCKVIAGIDYYTCILSEGAPLDPRVKIVDGKLYIPKDLSAAIIIDESRQRKKSFINLKHLETYHAYFFVRNTAGLSQMSESLSILCV